MTSIFSTPDAQASVTLGLEKTPLLINQSPGSSQPLRARPSGAINMDAVSPRQHPKSAQAPPQPEMFGLSWTAVCVMYYGLCSSTMLVINKVAVHNIPAPASVLTAQMTVAAALSWGGGALGLVEVDALEWPKMRKFIWVVFGFVLTLFANFKVLQHSNVETFITFRSSTPLLLSLCDYWFLGRALPTLRSWACLIVLMLGALGYVMVDTAFEVTAYMWLLVWYAGFTFDAVYVKHVCDNVRMSNWGRVFYTNVLSIPLLACLVVGLQEQYKMAKMEWSTDSVIALTLACLVGVCMSHAAYLLREATSATLFTMVGILCKLLTVVINYFIWDKHASWQGITFLMICLAAGTLYEQAPKRQDVKPLTGAAHT